MQWPWEEEARYFPATSPHGRHSRAGGGFEGCAKGRRLAGHAPPHLPSRPPPPQPATTSPPPKAPPPNCSVRHPHHRLPPGGGRARCAAVASAGSGMLSPSPRHGARPTLPLAPPHHACGLAGPPRCRRRRSHSPPTSPAHPEGGPERVASRVGGAAGARRGRGEGRRKRGWAWAAGMSSFNNTLFGLFIRVIIKRRFQNHGNRYNVCILQYLDNTSRAFSSARPSRPKYTHMEETMRAFQCRLLPQTTIICLQLRSRSAPFYLSSGR